MSGAGGVGVSSDQKLFRTREGLRKFLQLCFCEMIGEECLSLQHFCELFFAIDHRWIDDVTAFKRSGYGRYSGYYEIDLEPDIQKVNDKFDLHEDELYDDHSEEEESKDNDTEENTRELVRRYFGRSRKSFQHEEHQRKRIRKEELSDIALYVACGEIADFVIDKSLNSPSKKIKLRPKYIRQENWIPFDGETLILESEVHFEEDKIEN